MLVLSRSLGETICITEKGVTVTVTLISNKAGVVRLGVDAPKEVLIRREELCVPEQGEENEH